MLSVRSHLRTDGASYRGHRRQRRFFLRIMKSAGLGYLNPSMSDEDRYFGYMTREFKLVPIEIGGYASTQLFLVLMAALLNKLLYSTTVFDIRFMAAVYTVLLCTALYLIVRYNKTRSTGYNVILATVVVFIFADIGYIGYFNTLFGEPVSYVFFAAYRGSRHCAYTAGADIFDDAHIVFLCAPFFFW